MATYAIGDLQGCLRPLERLLEKLGFDRARDRLWFVGDLVNRGPDSLGVVRFLRDLGDAAISVLGNHDLHLLTLASGLGRPGKRDTLDPLLEAPDRDELIRWLRHRPLVHWDERLRIGAVHAGLLPTWTISQAKVLATEVEDALRGSAHRDFLRDMYGDTPKRWDTTLTGVARLRAVVNACTRLRYCTAAGDMDFSYKGPPGTQPEHLVPWFDLWNRSQSNARVVFGHWSTLGVGVRGHAISLDGGCVWGARLSAMRLDDGEFFHVDCHA